jgi:class 3 adenylate cyclase
MKIKSANTTCCKKCLQLSMPVDMMIRFALLVNPRYDFYKRAGFKEGMPIPNDFAAERLVKDMVEDGYYVDFAETLIQIGTRGYMGHSYKLMGLDGIVAGLIDEGYTYDKERGQFFENQKERISPNWGRLQEGDERKMTLLRLDIAGNSDLVRNNPPAAIKKAYNDIRNIVNRAVTSRIGRLWSWEGDGALAAFLFGPMEKMAIYAGMNILHEIFFYNRLHNPLDSPVNLRLGAHKGQVQYSNSELERVKNETAKEAMVLESLAKNNALCVSSSLYMTMDQEILELFSTEKTGRGHKYRLYSIGHEK